jgi:hypothetical protein
MAVNGQIAFPSGAAAKQGMPEVAQLIKHIDLKWGDDLRVDPLSPQLAVVGLRGANFRPTLPGTTSRRLATSPVSLRIETDAGNSATRIGPRRWLLLLKSKHRIVIVTAFS